MQEQLTQKLALALDKRDSLKKFRKQFYIPKNKGKEVVYFTGNSLGLQPLSTQKFIQQELKDWATLGVEGHLHAKRPWLYYHHFSKKSLAKLVGAKPVEVVAMNQLTVNLHLMLTTFYRPTSTRYKIIAEAGAFSSDQYAFESQLKLHGLNPETSLIELKPRGGEDILRTSDIVAAIKEQGDALALVMIGAVQYYTGQLFDIKKIVQAAHEVGAYAGFDCAHAIGNVPLQLHKHNVDFAVWCSYKYLNSGAGGVAGVFVHEKHHKSNLPRMAGWWGHHEKERFQMKKGFVPMAGADGWQLSNFPVLQGAAHLASLQIFDEAGIQNLRKKSEQLTGYLYEGLKALPGYGKTFKILTPQNPKERGCQLSIYMVEKGKEVFTKLSKAGIVADWREPGVIRVAPVPLYNTFTDVYIFIQQFNKALK
jgi:kynureninase